jgi:hypothetical protein
MGDQYHMDKSAGYRATLFLTHRAWLAMIPAQAASNERDDLVQRMPS